MPNEEIQIDISPSGEVTVEGKNFTGAECKTLTAELEKALGAVTKSTNKPEYHRTATRTRKVGA